MRFVGTSKIGRLSAKKGKIYAQIRLPPHLADTIGEIADVFETERNGKRAFLLVTKQSVLDADSVLQPGTKVVKQCAGVAQKSTKTHAITSDSTQQTDAESSLKSTAESFNINTQLVSCALCNLYFCTSPGSVAAYHGALSRLRLGFKSRLGRSFFVIYISIAFIC